MPACASAASQRPREMLHLLRVARAAREAPARPTARSSTARAACNRVLSRLSCWRLPDLIELLTHEILGLPTAEQSGHGLRWSLTLTSDIQILQARVRCKVEMPFLISAFFQLLIIPQ